MTRSRFFFFSLPCLNLQDLLRVARFPRFENLQLHRTRCVQQFFPLQRLQDDQEGSYYFVCVYLFVFS